MKTVGIIAEYNPFHNGHALLIDRLRDPNGPCGATHVAVVMSGNFVQRGAPALCSKHDRAAMALAGGADLVIELPVPWAMASAEHFAEGAVALLGALGCVDAIGFGSACGDITALSALADRLEDERFPSLLAYHLRGGVPFPEARQAALQELGGQAELLQDANNTLGLEYIKALRKLALPITPVTIKRIGAAHDARLPHGNTASASYIRSLFESGRTANAPAYIPPYAAGRLTDACAAGRAPAAIARIERVLLAKLRTMSIADLAALPNVTEGLENRLFAAAREAVSYEDLLERVKTRRYPRTRLQRILWAALIGIPRSAEACTPPYIRPLACNRRGEEILAHAGKEIPVLSRAAHIERMGDFAHTVWALENRATDLYALALPTPPPCGAEYTDRLIREDML